MQIAFSYPRIPAEKTLVFSMFSSLQIYPGNQLVQHKKFLQYQILNFFEEKTSFVEILPEEGPIEQIVTNISCTVLQTK